MLDQFPFSNEWKNKSDMLNFIDLIRRLTSFHDMNQYMAQSPIALEALRKLWETGKVSQMKSPFYEPVEKPKANYV